MFRLISVLPLLLFLSANANFVPKSNNCTRAPGDSGLWWGRSDQPCEVLDESGEDCGVCTKGIDDPKRPLFYNNCFIIRLMWKFNFREIGDEGSKKQICFLNDHCKTSLPMTYAQKKSEPDLLYYVCGTVDKDGKHETRGECKSAYATYICECHETYYGRNCNDREGPFYATGVQALLNSEVKVTDPMSILIAVKEKGDNLKVHVNYLLLDTILTITEPTIDDPSGSKLIRHCEQNTMLKTLCATYLKGSTSIYSLSIRFPLVRDNSSVWYYMTPEDYPGYPVGYMQDLIITTTNTINGVEKESFFRTNYNRKYSVFVKYPVDIGCYKNTKIVNCKELQNKVNIYDASSAIAVHGELSDERIHENVPGSESLKCNTMGDDTIKWKVSQVMLDGKFRFIDEHKSEDAFEFFIKPYSLTAGMHVVEFSYTMSTKWDVRENFDQCYFTVVEGPLIAIIEGGRSRYADVDSVIILDGSGSYDSNLQGKDSKVGLTFRWRCTTNQTQQSCLEDYMSPNLGSPSLIKLPPYVLEAKKGYIINLDVTKEGKDPASASQTLFTGTKGNVKSIEISCVNCEKGNIANPTDYIYLLADVVLKPDADIERSTLKLEWTFSTYPVYPPDSSTDSIRVNQTGQELLKIDKNRLEHNKTYTFRVELQGNKSTFSEIDIRTSHLNDFSCTLSPDSGVVATTNFTLNCSLMTGFTYEVYDKSSSDPNYYSGRMLFTEDFSESFKLTNNKLVVYGYNSFKSIRQWSKDVTLTPFNGQLKDVDDMVQRLDCMKASRQNRLHSTSVIPGALTPEMDWSSIHLARRLILVVYQVKVEAMRDVKLVLSSLEFILSVMSKNDAKKDFKLEVEEAKMCADTISTVADGLFLGVKNFDGEDTLIETILHQMIRSHLNIIEIVLKVRSTEVLSKPLHLVNPYVLHLVKDTTYTLVDALYTLSSCLLWRKIQEDHSTEIVSTGSDITQWAMVHHPEILYHLRRQNQNVPFNFSIGFYKIMKNLKVFGIQITRLEVNPFWWAGGDINTNVLLVDICFKVNPTQCNDYQRIFYKAPILLYFNISQSFDAIKPLEIHTVYLNLTKDPRDLDLDITVYRFDPPLRAKLFIQFEFDNSTEDYKVLFSINKRPDFDMMNKTGITINNENQSKNQYVKYTRHGGDKFYYMGIIPVHQGAEGKKVKVKLKIVYAVCKTWLRWKWGSERCWVGDQETDERTLRCDCNHLSMFAGAVQVPPYVLNPALEFMLFLTEEFNWLPVIVMSIILVLFVVLYVWGCLKDRTDALKGIVTILEDNYPGESYAYLLGVYTGSRINSSTNANVGIKLLGKDFTSRAHILKNRNRPTLRGNSDDWFLLYSPAHLGTLDELYIWHDNSGKSPDWFVVKIEVYDLTDKLKYIFELNTWLALRVDEHPEAVVATSSVGDFCSVRRAFLSNVVTGFRDTNYWTSIFTKHARNPVRRVHRISVVLCYVMVAMVCSAALYHFNKGEEYEEDEPSYKLDSTDFIIFSITILVASVIAWLVMLFFRKSYSHGYINTESSLFLRPEDSKRFSLFYSSKRNEYRSQKDISKNLEKLSMVSLYDSVKPRFIELLNRNDKFIKLGRRRKLPSERSMYESLAVSVHAIVRGNVLNPVRLPNYKNSLILHKKYFITAWILFLIIISASVAVVILLGHRILRVESKKWLTILLCTFLFDAMILSTLKILVCSAILGCVFQRLVLESCYQIKAEDGMNNELFGDKKYLFKLAKTRSNPMYFPLNDHLKELYRQKCIRRANWRTLIDFLVILLLILTLVMLNAWYTVNYFRSNSHAIRVLTQGPSYKYQNFTEIYNRTMYSRFLVYNLIDQLHRYLWYNHEDALNGNDQMRRDSWAHDCTTRLLGNVRIRQLRVVLGECANINYFNDTAEDYCSPPWSYGVEDTGTYGSRWYVGRNEPIRRKSRAWRYTDAARANSSVSYGVTLTVYPAGGYVEDLGFTKDDIEDTLASLIPQNWLDHTTRAVFVELTLYNVNTGLFTQVVLVAEQMPTGEYLVAVKSESVTTDFSFDIWKFSFSVFFIFFLVRSYVLVNRNGFFVHFSKIINIYELSLLALGFFTFSFYLVHILSSADYVQEFQRSGTDEFFNFFTIVSYRDWARTVLCVLFVCLVVRMLFSLRFGRIFFTFYYTFLLSWPWIVWLVLYFTMYLLVIRRFISHSLNLFIFPYRSTVIIYHKDFSVSECEEMSYKVLVYLMCLSSYVVILFFIASFAYYYKVAKVYKLIDTDKLNFFRFLIEKRKSRPRNK